MSMFGPPWRHPTCSVGPVMSYINLSSTGPRLLLRWKQHYECGTLYECVLLLTFHISCYKVINILVFIYSKHVHLRRLRQALTQSNVKVCQRLTLSVQRRKHRTLSCQVMYELRERIGLFMCFLRKSIALIGFKCFSCLSFFIYLSM